MNFNKVKQSLLENISDIVAVHNLLKNALGAKFLDILFYDKDKKVFFDKINNITIDAKYLDKNSVIGYVFMSNKAYYSSNITAEKHYDLALDNPFKLDIFDQIIIPISFQDSPKGILRFSMLPLGFCSQDYRKFLKLIPIFKQIFLKNNFHLDEEITLNTNKKRLDKTIKEMKSLFKVLEELSLNPETFKMIEYGQKNMQGILNYLKLEESKNANKNLYGTRA